MQRARLGRRVARRQRDIDLTVVEGAADAGAICIEIAKLKATIVDLGELEPGTYTIAATNSRIPPVVRHGQLTGAGRARPDGPPEPPPYFDAVNVFDLVVVVLVVVAVVIGFRSGALPQLGRPRSGRSLGGGLAILVLPHLDEPARIDRIDPQLRAFVVLAAILFCVGIGEAIGSAVGRTAAAMLGEGVFGAMDRVFGGVRRRRPGAARRLADRRPPRGRPQPDARQPGPDVARRPDAGRAYLPAPTEIAAELAQMLDDTGLPDLFVGLEPLPAPPVDAARRPARRAARRGRRNPARSR